MRKSFGRAVVLTLVSIGAVAAPTPAVSQDYEQLGECYRGCYQAYVVMTQQPAFYDMCKRRCYEMYGDGLNAAAPPSPLGVTRYN